MKLNSIIVIITQLKKIKTFKEIITGLSRN